MAGETKSLEDMIIHQMDLETLQKAVQSLTQVQKERLHLYFEGMTSVRLQKKQASVTCQSGRAWRRHIKKIKKFSN